ncbi:MAG TPA: ChaB family protein [Candidatus Paceibacterota bacterium]|nr:ChaB family protein [Candidatus Paceibacterota bacterium]
MPYSTRDQLPDDVQNVLRNVPHAQDIYREAYNSAWEQYANPADRQDDSSREETAHAVAWSAVKQQYKKGEDEQWHPK